MQELTKV